MMDEVDLLDKLCDELDSRGIEGNVIERDILNGNPYVVIWPGKFEDRTIVLTEELFFVYIGANRYYEVLPSAKYRRYFGERFWSCRGEKRGYYIMTFLRLVDTIEYLFKKENNMSNVEETSIKELCKIIADEAANSPLRWTDLINNRIYIHNLTDGDNVCIVQVYGAVYYLYFYNRKYGDIAKEIKDTNIIKVTDKGGYRFNWPGHVVSFIKKVVNKADHVNEKPITMKDLPTIRAVDVIFNDPATIILWADGTKTVVKAENEPFDPEKGLAMAISKKVLGNKYDYYDVFKKCVGRYEKKQKKGKK